MIEPVIVIAPAKGTGYRLLSGYRRCAAAKLAGLLVVPAVVQLDARTGFSQKQVRELQLVENIQRQQLSPLEEARAFQEILSSEGGVTQAELAKRVGKSQPYVANRVRLLGLPETIVKSLESGSISPSHGEVFLQLPKEASPTEVKDLLDRTKREGLSTHQLAERGGGRPGRSTTARSGTRSSDRRRRKPSSRSAP